MEIYFFLKGSCYRSNIFFSFLCRLPGLSTLDGVVSVESDSGRLFDWVRVGVLSDTTIPGGVHSSPSARGLGMDAPTPTSALTTCKQQMET